MPSTSEDRERFYRSVDETVEVLFALVGEAVGWATTALLNQDLDAANRVIEGEEAFDRRCEVLTELVKQRLAASSVRADELESLATILQIIPELERSADLAEHIAQRSLQGLGGMISPLSRGLVQSIGETAIEMWGKVGDHYRSRSRDAALALDDADNELDELCASLVSEGTAGVQDPDVVVSLALIARFYERLGDHAVNLARRVDALAAPRRLSPLGPLAEVVPLRGAWRRLGRWQLLARIRRLRLAPKDDRFFELFDAAASNARDCATELRKLVVSPSEMDDQADRIKTLERHGDDLTIKLLRLLDASFITPYDREDIHALVEELDDVVDAMFSASSLMQLLRIQSPLPDLVELADLLLSMSDELVELISGMRSRDGARYHLERIEQLEHHGDALYRRTIQRLFSGEYDAIEILKWKDIVQAFENTANAIEDVSDVVESILIKES